MKKQLLSVNLARLQETIDQSARIGGLPKGGICRLALTDEDKAMRDLFKQWLIEAGLEVRIDDFGNMYGRREGKNREATSVMVGSHLDTQPFGGRYDGILGVLSALEVIRVLNENQMETERPIEIVNFTNEEGARFAPPMLGSGGITGAFRKDFIYQLKDNQGNSFAEELERIGYKGLEENRPQHIHSFVEVHVEQGPVLEQQSISMGAVEGIQGMTWLEVKLKGQSDHAGPTPMSMRKDALVAAAKMIVAIEQTAPEMDEQTTTTVGRLSLEPGSINCVPGEVTFSVDIRHFDNIIRNQVLELIYQKLSTIAAVDDIGIEITKLWEIESTHFSQEIVNYIVEASHTLGYSVQKMISGAGHDAKYMNDIAPTAMIFLPSVDGKSHCEEELTLIEDIEEGANVLLQVIYSLAQMAEEIEK